MRKATGRCSSEKEFLFYCLRGQKTSKVSRVTESREDFVNPVFILGVNNEFKKELKNCPGFFRILYHL